MPTWDAHQGAVSSHLAGRALGVALSLGPCPLQVRGLHPALWVTPRRCRPLGEPHLSWRVLSRVGCADSGQRPGDS